MTRLTPEASAREHLTQIAGQFRDARTEAPLLEAKTLLKNVTGWSGADLILREDEKLTQIQLDTLNGFVDERIAGKSIAHIIGYADFYGLRFKVDERALIPRSDSEVLVEAAIEAVREKGIKCPLIVDLGTGSGCLILSLLHTLEGAKGVGLDVSDSALSLAQENAEAHDIGSRIEWLQGRWGAARDSITRADIVISNPPYIRSDVIPTLAVEVKDHDPMLALDGGEDGLTAYRDIIRLCSDQLQSGVPLILEIGYDQSEAVQALLSAYDFHKITVKQDLSGHFRVISAQKA